MRRHYIRSGENALYYVTIYKKEVMGSFISANPPTALNDSIVDTVNNTVNNAVGTVTKAFSGRAETQKAAPVVAPVVPINVPPRRIDRAKRAHGKIISIAVEEYPITNSRMSYVKHFKTERISQKYAEGFSQFAWDNNPDHVDYNELVVPKDKSLRRGQGLFLDDEDTYQPEVGFVYRGLLFDTSLGFGSIIAQTRDSSSDTVYLIRRWYGTSKNFYHNRVTHGVGTSVIDYFDEKFPPTVSNESVLIRLMQRKGWRPPAPPSHITTDIFSNIPQL